MNVYFITLGLKGGEYCDIEACQESPFRKSVLLDRFKEDVFLCQDQ